MGQILVINALWVAVHVHVFTMSCTIMYILYLRVCVCVVLCQGEEGWVGLDEEPLTGFSWRGGIQRDTTGILMWSKPYIVPLPHTGEQVYTLYIVCIIEVHVYTCQLSCLGSSVVEHSV